MQNLELHPCPASFSLLPCQANFSQLSSSDFLVSLSPQLSKTTMYCLARLSPLFLCCPLKSDSMQKARGMRWLSSCASLYARVEFLQVSLQAPPEVLLLFLSASFHMAPNSISQTNYVEILKCLSK